MTRVMRIAAVLVAMTLTLTLTSHAQTITNLVCPTGTNITKNTNLFNLPLHDTQARTYITLGTKEVTLARVVQEATNASLAGASEIDSARVLWGLVDRTGNFVHFVYAPLGIVNSGASAPAKTITWHSLKPVTRYESRIFADRLKRADDTPISGKVNIARLCFQTQP